MTKTHIVMLSADLLQSIQDQATGNIGRSPIERAFCGYAHHKARDPDGLAARTWYQCRFLVDETFCGLCDGGALCLFLEPTAAEWSTIHESERIRAERERQAENKIEARQ